MVAEEILRSLVRRGGPTTPRTKRTQNLRFTRTLQQSLQPRVVRNAIRLHLILQK